MKIKSLLLIGSLLFSTIFAYAASVEVTVKYGKTGGIVGKLNSTTDKINGKEICPADPTKGCDFSDDPGYNNNNTVDNPHDDSYSGDLLIRTNDIFQIITGWNWNDPDKDGEDTVTLTGTLPLKDGKAYYEWTELPGSCDLDSSSISEDKQTIVCVRKGFDKNSIHTKAEDITFNVRVLGGTPNATKPGDINFKIESKNAEAKEDDTDGYSLTVTCAPRWNLQKSAYSFWAGKEYDVDGDGTKEKGWVANYIFYIESDEVNGEVDSVNPIVGNESMGKDATFTFTDIMANMPPHAKLMDCNMNGRWDVQDGYVGSGNPTTCHGSGCIQNDDKYKNRHILAAKGEQVVTCTQSNPGADISVKVEHVNATLDHYPIKNYSGKDLPVNRAIAAIGSIDIFIPLDDVKVGPDGTEGTDDDGEFKTTNYLTDFDPTTPTGNSNFNDDTESEKDNRYSRTFYYAAGDWNKYYRGGGSVNYDGRDHLDYVWGYVGTGYRSGDGMITRSGEFSTFINTSNSGGTAHTEDTTCDVLDAYRLKVQAVKDNIKYKNIGNRYTGSPDIPYRFYINGDDGNYTDANGIDGFPYVVEYATDYEDDSFLPSRGGDTTIEHKEDIKRECNAPDNKWTTNFEEAMNGAIGITKIRLKLKPGYEQPSGSSLGFWINHKVREIDLATGNRLKNNSLVVNYAAHKFNYNSDWSLPSYIPGVYPGNHSGSAGDRVMVTGPKVRIKKLVNRNTASPGVEVTYTLQTSYTDDIGSEGKTGDVKVTDVLPKEFNYVKGSTTPSEFGEPDIGNCSDVADLNVPCTDGVNKVLIWDYGTREVNSPEIADLNFTIQVGASAKKGSNINYAKIESSTDASSISQRRDDAAVTIDVPSTINIVKSTEDNPDYPIKRERTIEPKDIWFLMDMRNGTDNELTNLDSIDILPFIGDGDEKSINFNSIQLNRPDGGTQYHGTMVYKEASFMQNPNSDTECNADNIKYYYTNADSKTINIAPSVGDENDISNEKSIWCEGDKNGPNGCTIESSGFTFTNNSEVTALRVKGATMAGQAVCQFRVKVTVQDNLAGDKYVNSAGAAANGVTLPVLSNSVAAPIVGSSLGDVVWKDQNKDGIQDEDEEGIAGVKVYLLDENGEIVKKPGTDEDYIVTTDADGKYSFNKLNHGNYKVKFDLTTLPKGFEVTKKDSTYDSKDSDVDEATGETSVVALGVDDNNPTLDLGVWEYTPSIDIEKHTNGVDADTADEAANIAPDADVTWEYIVTNIGDEKLLEVVAIDDKEGAISCPKDTLEPGESMKCFNKYSKATNTTYENKASVSAKGYKSEKEVTDFDLSHYKVTPEPSIDIEKATNGHDADSADEAVELSPNADVVWSYVVKNIGNETITDITVEDNKEGAVTCPQTSLAPGESMNCSSKYGVASSATYSNEATVTGKGKVSGIDVTDKDRSNYKVNNKPSIDIEKHTNGVDADTADSAVELAPNQSIVWEYIVTNNGNEELTDIVATDDKEGAITCPKTTLKAGESMSCSAKTSKATNAEYENIATVSAKGKVSNTDVTDEDLSHYKVVYKPSIDIEKHTNGVDADTADSAVEVSPHAKIVWEYIVTNIGNEKLLEIVAKDDKEGAITCPKTSLEAGESMRCTAKSGKADSATYENKADVAAKGEVSKIEVTDEDLSHYIVNNKPSIDIEKHTNGVDADSQLEAPKLAPNEVVTWDYIVTNSGNEELIDIVVADDKEGNITCPKTELAPGESMKCTAKTGMATVYKYENRATVSAKGKVSAKEVTDADLSHYQIEYKTSIDVEKSTNGEDADTIKGVMIKVGKKVTWEYNITNTGNEKLNSIVLKDDKLGEISCPNTSLDVNKSMVCIKEGIATIGQYENISVVSAIGESSKKEVKDEDPSHYFGVEPKLELQKHTNRADADKADGSDVPKVEIGSRVIWEYIVTNSGNVKLTDIKVSDDKEANVTCPKTELNPSESMTCIKTGVAKAGLYENIATASAKSPEGVEPPAEVTDPSHYIGVLSLGDRVWKDSNHNGLQDSGEIGVDGVEVILYDKDGNIAKDANGNELAPQITSGGGKYLFTNLLPGEYVVEFKKSTLPSSAIFTTQDSGDDSKDSDINSDTSKSAVVTLSDKNNLTIDAGIWEPTPNITLEKSTNGDDADSTTGPILKVGDIVTWEFNVTNSGEETLEDIKVIDNKEGEISCSKTELAVKESMVCTKTAKALKGQYENIATVSAKGKVTSKVTQSSDPSHYFGAEPSIDIEKYTNGVDADTNESAVGLTPNSDVAWDYIVTNIGNEKVIDIKVVDDKEGVVTCPKDYLDAGESMKCITKFAKAVEDSYENRATVTAKGELSNTEVTDEDLSHYKTNRNTSVDIEKHTNGIDADTEDKAVELAPNADVEWEYIVVNNGNEKIIEIKVVDDKEGVVTCPKDYLEPGESMKCINKYGKATEDSYENSATVTAKGELSSKEVTDEDLSHYKAVKEPSIDIEKHTNGIDADTKDLAVELAPNSNVEWEYIVTNRGNEKLVDIKVEDNKEGIVECPKDFLEAGESMKCFSKYGRAIEDSYENSAIVTAKGELSSKEVTDEDLSHYKANKKPSVDIEKHINGADADTMLKAIELKPNEAISWEYIVTNNGNEKISAISVVDDKEGEVSCPKDFLEVGESMKCMNKVGKATYDEYTNIATVKAEGYISKTKVTDSDAANYKAPKKPSIDVEKSTNGVDADTKTEAVNLTPNADVEWEYTVTNIGNEKIVNIALNDDIEGVVKCPKDYLEAGESMKCTNKYGKAIKDLYRNIATVTGSGELSKKAVTDADTSYYKANKEASVDIEKHTNGVDADTEAEAINLTPNADVEWEYLVVNNGNEKIVNIKVADDKEGIVKCPKDYLEAGESMKCINKYGKAINGKYENKAIVTAIGELSKKAVTDEDLSHYKATQKPSIKIEKHTNGKDADSQDLAVVLYMNEAVTWEYIVINNGNEKITDIVAVDDKEGSINCPKNYLEAGESMKCFNKYARANKDSYKNIATVIGRGVNSQKEVNDTDPSHYKTVKTACIGDTIWQDINGNGIQDEGEKPLSGAKFELLNADGTPAVEWDENEIAPQITAVDGKYMFCNLKPGSYKVKVTLPDAIWRITSKEQGSNRAKDSSFNQNTLTTDVVILKSGEKDITQDVGVFKPASIGNYIWEDKDANGVQDSNEKGIAGVELQLVDVQGNIVTDVNGDEVVNITTTKDGKYEFKNLVPGEYQVKIVTLPKEYIITREKATDNLRDSDVSTFLGKEGSAMPKTMLISDEHNLSFDAGVFKPVCLGDFVWKDTNVNGIQDEGEEPIEAIDVKLIPLKDSSGNINTTFIDGSEYKEIKTDANGHYEFCNLVPGRYKVAFKSDKLYISTKKDNNDDKNSDVDEFKSIKGVWLESVPKDIESGDNMRVNSIDAGFVEDLCLGDFIWHDENINGLQDSNEPGVVGIKVSLYDANKRAVKDIYGNVVKAIKTDKKGYYKFCHIQPANDYYIKVELPDSYTVTIQDVDKNSKDNKDNDTNKDGWIFVKNLTKDNYSYDTGIICDCEEYELEKRTQTNGSSNSSTKSSASTLNIFGLLSLLLLIITSIRREK